MVGKSFKSCSALCNYMITICISITSILLKVPLIEAFIIAHNFDIVWLSETFLDSKTPQNDGYSLIKS